MATLEFRIGSIRGIDIRIDYSWFVIVFLILWTLTKGLFPSSLPGLSEPTYLVMGLVGTALFFLSLLGHELSHSFVARAKGIEVAGITLFIFGGMAHTKAEATTPGDEFQIAGVGPLSSFVIALLFASVVWVGRPLGWSPAVLLVASYLAYINRLLALFNLLPGFPLDGGRIFRSIVWKATGSLERATRWASWTGQAIAWVLIALGVYAMWQERSFLAGVWYVFIGWFLRNAAVSSYRQSRLQAVLEHGRAGDVMARDPETVPPDLTLQRLADDYFMRSRYGGFPVVQSGRALGLITLAQLKEVPRESWPRRTVADTMVPLSDSMVVGPDDSMRDALRAIQATAARRALVLRDGALVGVIAPADLSEWLERIRSIGGAQR